MSEQKKSETAPSPETAVSEGFGVSGQKKFRVLHISRLVKADWNYKENNTQLAEKLKENIKRNGQVENLLVRKLPTGFYEVINGNHRLDVLKELGFQEVVVYDFGEISNAQAMRVAIETNETQFPVDHYRLAGVLREIKVEFDEKELIASLPYTEQELESFDLMLNVDWDKIVSDSNKQSNKKGKKKKPILATCPRCGCSFDAADPESNGPSKQPVNDSQKDDKPEPDKGKDVN